MLCTYGDIYFQLKTWLQVAAPAIPNVEFSFWLVFQTNLMADLSSTGITSCIVGDYMFQLLVSFLLTTTFLFWIID